MIEPKRMITFVRKRPGEILETFILPFRGLDDMRLARDHPKVSEVARLVETDSVGEISLRDHDDACIPEDMRVFTGLIRPFGGRAHHEIGVLAQEDARRAHEIADILDEEVLLTCQIKPRERPFDHMRSEMATGMRVDLDRADSDPLQAPLVDIGLKIPLDDRKRGWTEPGRELFDDSRLAGTRRAHDIDAEDALGCESFPKRAGDDIIGRGYRGVYLDDLPLVLLSVSMAAAAVLAHALTP